MGTLPKDWNAKGLRPSRNRIARACYRCGCGPDDHTEKGCQGNKKGGALLPDGTRPPCGCKKYVDPELIRQIRRGLV